MYATPARDSRLFMRAVKGTYIGGQNLLCLNDVTKATEPQLYFWFQFWI